MKTDKKRSINIILPHHSFAKIDDEDVTIDSIRVVVNPKIEKFQMGFISEKLITKEFTVKDLSIRIYSDEKLQLDVLDFLNKEKKSVACIYMQEKDNTAVYQKYIKSMMI